MKITLKDKIKMCLEILKMKNTQNRSEGNKESIGAYAFAKGRDAGLADQSRVSGFKVVINNVHDQVSTTLLFDNYKDVEKAVDEFYSTNVFKEDYCEVFQTYEPKDVSWFIDDIKRKYEKRNRI